MGGGELPKSWCQPGRGTTKVDKNWQGRGGEATKNGLISTLNISLCTNLKLLSVNGYHVFQTGAMCLQLWCHQWWIQRSLGNTVVSREFQDRSPNGHNPELWRLIFSYKHVWMAWVKVIYYEKCNYYVLSNCNRHCVRGEFIQNYFKIFNFLLIWDKNSRSHIDWAVKKPFWIHHWSLPTK